MGMPEAVRSIQAVTRLSDKAGRVSEKLEASKLLIPNGLAGRILDMGDVVNCRKGGRSNRGRRSDAHAAHGFGKFDMNDFLTQLRQLQKMGGLGGLSGMSVMAAIAKANRGRRRG